MAIRRMGAVLALSTMAIVGTATAAAARDYPPTTSVITKASVVTATTAAPNSASTGLPFTGGNDLELVWIGAAFAGAGALAVARTRRNHRNA